MTPQPEGHERLRRWRLALGEAAEESTGTLTSADDSAMDAALAALYDAAAGDDDDGTEPKSRRSAGGR